MTSAFYGKAQGVVITFDVGQRDSYTSIDTWLRDIKQVSPHSGLRWICSLIPVQYAPSNCAIFLCANKVDLTADQWRIRKEEFDQYARELNLPLYECSASSGLNVNKMFTELGKQILFTCRDQLTKVENEHNGQTGNSIILAEFAERQRKEKKPGSCCRS